MARDDFDLFWTTHLHTADSSSQSSDAMVLYWHSVKEETANYPWTRREATLRQHALAAVARDIMTQVRVATRKATLAVTVLQNVSPCSECAAELIKALNLAKEKKVKLEVSVAFVALHKIRRPSCVQRGHPCAGDVFLNESNDNALALRSLSEEGVKVMTFNPTLWQFFHTFVGMGLPSAFPNSFLSGKYSGAACQPRMVEDSLMANELRAILTGVQITSSSISPDPDTYTVEWRPPTLSKKKVSEYRVIYKKVTLKNKDSEDRLWRIHQTVSSTPFKLSVPGEMTSRRLEELERDSFYDLTVEALLGGGVVCSARKIFKTDDKGIKRSRT
ncbi:hypothetical protein BaRGS_00014159 [Batillaria attramentaria]|uniref:Activation-induced cytidine deaminase AID domain-containing protein n=1 Tax=Batillaria attramentaria TaxID=370345 RepID=A0ABD0L5C9_9CAEN